MLTLELLSPKPTTTLLNTFLTFLTLTFAKDFDILCIIKNQAPIYPPTYLSAKGAYFDPSSQQSPENLEARPPSLSNRVV